MKYNSEKIIFDCVEYDPNAISYASELCREFLPQITFNRANAFKFKTDRKYELIWSAGLFDYFNDKRFKFLLKCLYSFLAPGGELVIGNFSENNPTRNYMEILGDWILHHRSKKLLINLAEECGVSPDSIRVGEEAEGINLFLHITKPSES
ncbi:MAG TPA: class I SAM-dependent methyltransferase, partial [Pyrinomonadaceae bacterium]|nr:class I SAM-dependent methyltransferase [Pyrinomonadaceae bacterium]